MWGKCSEDWVSSAGQCVCIPPCIAIPNNQKWWFFPVLFCNVFYVSLCLEGSFWQVFFPEAGVQERMKEHGKDPLWKIKYEEHFIYLRISLIESKWCYKVIWLIRPSMKIIFLRGRVCIFRYASNGSTLLFFGLWQRSCSQVSHTLW